MAEILYPNRKVNVIIEPLREDIIMPEYNDEQDAGLDVFVNYPYADTVQPIDPGETLLIPLGFKLGIPDGWRVDVRPRSGISFQTDLRIANSPGTIDTNYKHEIRIILHNTSTREVYHITNGMKIAQLVIEPRFVMNLIPGKATDIGHDRGGGFGSSGNTKEASHGV